MDNSIQILKRLVVLLIFSCSALVSFGEGSRNLYPDGATLKRASLLSTTGYISENEVVGIRFPNPGRHFVYAKVGEVIHVGSSAQGVVGTGRPPVQTGTINLTAPNGQTYSSGTSTTVGRITGRSQELQGPTLNSGVDGGYNAYTVTVLSGQEGIWVVDFIAPANTVLNNGSNLPNPDDALNANSLDANASWSMTNQQTNSRYIVAWDVTVVNAGVFQVGRVYQTVFSADLGSAANELSTNAKFHILSKDGYRYLVEPFTGFQPFQFAFFANNKGLRFNSGSNVGASAYRSATNANVENADGNTSLPYDYHTPNSADDATNITHKIFYNPPDATNLPSTANIASSIYGTSTTWLYTADPVVPSLTNLELVGKEGTSGKFSTTTPLTGGFIKFNSSIPGAYRILIDANNDGDYVDAADLTIRGDAVQGANSVAWDGKDGQGNFIVNGANIKINAVTLAGEVHFPLADAEKNVNGLKITRINGAGAPSDIIYWDDKLLDDPTHAAASNPLTNLDNGAGQSSSTNGHKWGLNAGVADLTGSPQQWGDQSVIDTWANVFSAEQNLTVTINYQEANLEIVSLTGNLSNICVGTEVTYTFVAKNNGPNNSGDATVSFVFPSALTNLSLVSATVTTGTATGVGGTFSGTTFTDVLNMDNGAIVTYVVKGTIGSYPSGGNLNTSARILRAADVTDPDATNDDTSPPTDPVTECNGSPSGAGCNNIKDLTTTVQETPSTANAGSNQSKCNDGNFTMAATTPTVGSGTWSVVSGTATITSTTLTNTTVTGVPVGTTATLRWTVSNGTCTSTTSDVTLTNNASPSAANAGSNQSKCNDGSFTLAAATPTVGTGTWSVVSGTATITNATLTNTTITGVPVGTTATLRWTVSNGTCTATTADITLTNNNGPSAATLTTAATLTNCNSGTFNIGAVTPALGTGQWSLISGTATITNVNVTNTTATGIPTGTSAVLRWTVSSAGCTSNITDVTLVNNASPSAADAGSNQTKCNDGSFTLAATTPTVGTGTWSVVSGTATITNANLTNTTVTGVPVGTTATLRWTVSNGTCTATTADITLTNNALPSTANAGSNQSKCNDGSFTLAATTPTIGTGTWSVVSGTGTIANANLTNTGVTGVPVGTTVTLRWTVSNGTCTSTTADITLTNSALPSTANAGSDQTKCNDGSFTLAATTPTIGTGTWSVVSGTATITNANLTNTTVTGVPVGTTATLRWTVSNGTCTATTADITLTNNNGPSAAVLTTAATLTNCNNGTFNIGAVTPALGTGQWSLISGTAIITNTNATSTTATGIPVGTSAVLRWTVSSAGCTSNITDVTLTNNASPSAANAGSNQTKCNDGSFTLAATTPTVGTGAWSVVSGTATITNTTLTNTTVTGVPVGTTVTLRWTVSNGTCTATTADITLTNSALPSNANAGSNQSKCNDGNFTLAATTPAIGTGTWSVVSGTATITTATLTNTTVTGVPVGTTATLRWTVSNGTCTSTTADITLTNSASPSTADAGSNQTKCNDGSFTLAATTPAVGTGTWSVVSGTATITNANLTNTTVTGVPVGTTATLRWTVSNGTCTATTADITLTNNALPSTANAGSNQSKCNDGSFTLAATTPTVGTGTWSLVSGTATITTATLTNTTVTGVPVGTTATLRWTVSNGTCTSTTADITLTNSELPSAANAGSNQTKCNDGSFTLAATTPAVGTGTWSVVSGTATITNANLTNTTVTGVPVGTTATLRWTVSNGTCTATTADITLTNNNGPSAATLTTAATLTNCDNTSFNIGAVTPTVGTGQWSLISGTATITNVNVTSTTVTGIAAGTSAVIRWTVSSAGCSSTTVNVTLTNNALPSAANAGSNQTKCNDGSFTLAATTPAVGTGTWSVVSGTATITNANLTNTTVTGVPVGTTATLRWTVSSGTCTATTADITLTNNNGPSAATLTTAATLTNCDNTSFNIGAVTPTVGTGQWSLISGTATITNANATSTTATGIPAGTSAVLRWTVSNAGCTSNITDVTLVNNASPSAADAGSNQTKCNDGSFTLAATTPTVGTGTWSVVSGTATITNANLTNTTVTGVPVGTTATLRWTVSNGTCTSTTANITLTNQQPPSTANAGSNQSKCNDGNFTLAATTPTIGTGTWSLVSGTATITTATLTNTTVTGVPVGTTATLRWTVSNGTCTSSTADITLTNSASPSTANAGSNLTQCNNSSFTMAAITPSVGTGAWSVISGTATITTASLTNTTVTGVPVGTTATLRWTVSNGTCTATTANITVTNNALPSTANAGSNQSKCNDGSFTLAATTPTVGTGVWSVVSGTATITNVNLTNTGVTGVPVGTTATLRWTVSNGICSSSTADITLTNNATPSTANAGSNIVQCNNANFTLSATTPTVGTGTWSVVSGTATIANANLTNTTVTGVPVGTTVTLRWTVSNGTCTATTSDITLTNNPAPSTANAGTNQTNCNNDTFTLSAVTPSVGTGVWSLISGTATISNINLTNTTVTGIVAGSNATLRWTVSASGCTSNSADIVLSNQNAPSTANAGSNQTKCNDGIFTMAATTPSIGTGVWSIVSGSATIMSTTLTNTIVTGIPVGSSTTLRWTVSNSNCPSSTSDIILTNAVSVNAGSDITISCSTTAKLSAAASGQNWTAVSGNPSPAVINNNGEITGITKKGNYFFTLSNANCSATVKVTKANCPPVALNDTQTVRNDQLLTGTLSPKASDTDGDVLTFSVLIPPVRGTIVFNTDGSYVYTPPAGYIGTDSITYRVCDADGLCADAKLYIQVTGAPLPPVAVNDSAKTKKNEPVSGNLLANDHHSGTNSNTGLMINTQPVSGPSNGSVVINSDGSYTYTPANNFVGLDSFRYVICNAASLCDTATVYITVNEPPLFQPKLAIEKRVSPLKSKYGTGEIVTYTLVAKNTGNIIVNDISVQDILPPATKIKNVRMVQGTPNAGLASYEPFTNVIFWTIPFLHIGDSAVLKYTMVLSDSGTLVNTATISSLMINGTADTATVSIDVVNQADIKITKLLRAPAVISVNDEIGFTMIAENFGPAVGTEVVIQDSLYANLSDPRVMTVNIGKVSFDPVTRKISWRIDTLLVGQKDSLVIRVKIVSGGEIKNGATVKAKQADPVSGNNGAVVSNITGGQVLVEGRKFFIPSVITPNGDGKNDKFTILGINQFPGSELIIYNRWGNVVFQSKDYKNDWDGKGLNEGTYYYTLNLKTTTGSQRMAGWVEILR